MKTSLINEKMYTSKKHFGKFTTEQYTKIFIGMIAVLAGFLSIQSVAVNYLLTVQYPLSASSVQLFSTMMTYSPGILSPLWGLISDTFPIFGYRRKSYMIIISFFLTLIFLGLANFSSYVAIGLTLLFLSSMCASMMTVILRAIIAEISQNINNTNSFDEKSKQGETSKNVSLLLVGEYIPTVLVTFAGGVILANSSPQIIFYITMAFPLMIFLLAFTFPESKFTLRKRLLSGILRNPEINENLSRSTISNRAQLQQVQVQVQENDILLNSIDAINFDSKHFGIKDNLSLLWKFFIQPNFLKPAFFILFVNSFQFSEIILLKYFAFIGLNTPDFQTGAITLSLVGTTIGIICYAIFFKQYRFPVIFFWTTIVLAFGKLIVLMVLFGWNTTLGISDEIFAYISEFSIGFLLELNTLPLFVLSIRLCPQNQEGTVTALIISLSSMGSIIAGLLGSLLLTVFDIDENNDNNYGNLWIDFNRSNNANALPGITQIY